MSDQRNTTYQLHILLDNDIDLRIGKLGHFHFPAGEYIYTGSAKTNIDARIRRHLSGNKKKHWHIDYLLLHPAVMVKRVEKSTQSECALNQATKGRTLIPGFGASDCKAHCQSHLKYIG